MRATRLASAAAVVTSLVLAAEARADVSEGLTVAAVVGGVAFGLADIGLLSYDLVMAANETEPANEVMIAQCLITGPQAALGALTLAFTQSDRDDEAPGVTLAALVPATLANGLFVFGAWSLEGSSIDVAQRVGMSIMIGANMSLSFAALSASILDPHYAAPYLAVPEVVVGTVNAVPAFVQSVREPRRFGEWMSIGIWSSALTVHGALSLAANELRIGISRYEDARAKPGRPTAWSFAPAMIRPPWRMDGGGQSPGIMASGLF